MAARHRTQTRYTKGCRCEECVEAHLLYQRDYRQRKANGAVRPRNTVVELPAAGVPPSDPGLVESGVEAEISGLAQAELRPGLVAIAAAMARVLDSTPPTPKPAAAKVLVTVLDTLHKASTRGRRGGLALVRTMTTPSDGVEKGGA